MIKNKALAKVISPASGKIAGHMKEVLDLLGEDPSREGLVKTPERYEKAMRYLMSGYHQNMKDIVNDALFSVKCDEMVVVKTDKTPKQLMEKNGTANESTSVGEASDLAAGETKTVTIDLKPGRYILLCNLPGHYKAGMYHTFVVQ